MRKRTGLGLGGSIGNNLSWVSVLLGIVLHLLGWSNGVAGIDSRYSLGNVSGATGINTGSNVGSVVSVTNINSIAGLGSVRGVTDSS